MRSYWVILACFALVGCGGSATPAPSGGHDAAGDGPSLSDAAVASDVVIDAPLTDCNGGQPFADPLIEAAVRSELGKATGALTLDELATVTALSAPGAASLAGVQCLAGLEVLAAYGGTIEDLSPLKDLSNLASVVLLQNRIRSLLPLSNHAMRTIHVSDNAIGSLAGLVLPGGSCYSEFDLQRNPIGGSDVQPFCALGWVVTWGGADAAPTESCNRACP